MNMAGWKPARIDLGRRSGDGIIKIPVSLAAGYGLGFVSYFPARWAASALRLPSYTAPVGAAAVGVFAGAVTGKWNLAAGAISAAAGLYLLEIAGRYLPHETVV